MSAPVLAPIQDLLLHTRITAASIPDGVPADAWLFVVVASGVFGGRWFRPGDLVVCDGTDTDGDVVLVARGHGTPRLGSRTLGRLTGDAGEPCSEQRWRVAGTVIGVVDSASRRVQAVQRAGRGAVETASSSGRKNSNQTPASSEGRGGRSGRGVRSARRQLVLFAA